MSDEKEFRVVDRRASSGATESEKPTAAKGDGFTMKEKNEAPPSPNQLDFSTLVFSLATGSLIHMGLAPDPVTQKSEKNLDLAKQNIEILAILKDKTRGNLSNEEAKMLESLLAEVQLRFVEASR